MVNGKGKVHLSGFFEPCDDSSDGEEDPNESDAKMEVENEDVDENDVDYISPKEEEVKIETEE